LVINIYLSISRSKNAFYLRDIVLECY